MKRLLAMASTMLILVACANKEKNADATGTFEATETVLSAEQSGTLLEFQVSEADNVSPGQEIGIVDTTQTWLKIQQLKATREVYQSQKPDTEKQIAATRQQLAKARKEEQRYRELVNDGAVPSKMFDDAASQVKVLQRQLDAQISSLSTSTKTLDKQMAATDAQMEQLYDQLHKCHIVTIVGGIVLEKYAERGELNCCLDFEPFRIHS